MSKGLLTYSKFLKESVSLDDLTNLIIEWEPKWKVSVEEYDEKMRKLNNTEYLFDLSKYTVDTDKARLIIWIGSRKSDGVIVIDARARLKDESFYSSELSGSRTNAEREVMKKMMNDNTLLTAITEFINKKYHTRIAALAVKNRITMSNWLGAETEI
jgi:hypothetical protein